MFVYVIYGLLPEIKDWWWWCWDEDCLTSLLCRCRLCVTKGTRPVKYLASAPNRLKGLDPWWREKEREMLNCGFDFVVAVRSGLFSFKMSAIWQCILDSHYLSWYIISEDDEQPLVSAQCLTKPILLRQISEIDDWFFDP